MKKLCLLSIALLFTGCATTTPPQPIPPAVPRGETVIIAEELLTKCKEPVPLEGNAESVLISWILNFIGDYKDCSTRVDKHIDLLKSTFPDKTITKPNNKEPAK